LGVFVFRCSSPVFINLVFFLAVHVSYSWKFLKSIFGCVLSGFFQAHVPGSCNRKKNYFWNYAFINKVYHHRADNH